MKCPFCGSERIETEVAWGKSVDTGNVGLKYSTGKGLLSGTGIAEAYSDLCMDCGSIIRTYIKEETDKDWIHKPGALGTK